MAKLFIKLNSKRGFVLVAGVLAAALSAKTHGLSLGGFHVGTNPGFHTDGFLDGS